MFQPLSLFVGLRYVRARQHKFFVSFITWVSLLGVALGVAALIVVLSVMNGFGGELRTRLLSLSAHARVLPAAGTDLGTLAAQLRAVPGVVGVAPFAERDSLAVHLPEMYPLVLRGIDPAQELAVSTISSLMKAGELSALQPNNESLILGTELAQQLGVVVGDHLTLLIPIATAESVPLPRMREFVVAGLFAAGLSDHDSTLALTHLSVVQALMPAAASGTGLRLQFNDPLNAPQIMPAVRAVAGANALVRDWTQDHASYFRALAIEKGMMALILLLIVGVAAFNIVAMLVMVVNDKRTDIAILRTLGAAPRQVMSVFMIQGLAVGWLGVFVGVALGVFVALNVSNIVPMFEQVFGFQFLNVDTFAITQIPSELRTRDVAWIGSLALLLTLAATIYPALRAAATSPAEALRYE
jgi:lipoprotein-releasing system permease protein